MIGLVIAVYDFAELVAKPASGFLADRAGMKRTLLAGLAVFIVGSASFLVLPPSLLLVTRFVQGLGSAALSTVSITLVAKYFAATDGTLPRGVRVRLWLLFAYLAMPFDLIPDGLATLWKVAGLPS